MCLCHTVPYVHLQDCPAESEDFRAQQCSAYNDVQYQGHYYEWIPLYNDPAAPCALKCHARGQSLVVELAPKVLDGTRCNADSLDMCISGICQVSHTCPTRPGFVDGPCPFSVMRFGSFRCKCIPWERMHRAGFREMTDFSLCSSDP